MASLTYVGATLDPLRRLRQHQGEIAGGAKATSRNRPWKLMAIFGPFTGASDAMKAEYCLKKTKRGVARCHWKPEDSPWCSGLGVNDPRVAEANQANDSES